MIKNFIKVTLRNLITHKTFTLINVLGLSVGISCALIISLFLRQEYSYDKIHSNWKDIYRITVNGELNDVQFYVATSSGNINKFSYTEIEGIEQSVRVARFGAWLVSNKNASFNEDNLLFVDTNFFSFFDGFEFVKGNPVQMFVKPQSIVLTESAAVAYYGRTDVIGEKLLVETGDNYYTITGVVKDPPINSHIKFNMLASLVTYEKIISHWTSNNVYTYIKCNKSASVDKIEADYNELVRKFVLPEILNVYDKKYTNNVSYTFKLQPLDRIHLHSELESELEMNGKEVYVITFAIVALLILLIACLNFMNLSSANSYNRSLEVALRKTIGAERKFLIIQFLTESVLFSILSMILALIFTELFLPFFNSLLHLQLDFVFFDNITTVLAILLFSVAVGLFSGSYPAFFISSFDPVKVFQGELRNGVRGRKLRRAFVIVQFVIAVLIVILTTVIFAQTNYLLNSNLGFDKDYVVEIRRSDALGKDIGKFKEEISQISGVLSVANSNSIPGRKFFNSSFKFLDEEDSIPVLLNQIYVNFDFCKTLGIELLQGRFFDSEVSNDTFSCLINESAAKILNLSYPVGERIEQPSLYRKHSKTYTIIGVVKDFYFQIPEKPVQPLIINFMPGNWEGYLHVKVDPWTINNTLAEIENVWGKYSGQYPFVYFFLNDDFNENYNYLFRLGRLFIVFSVLSIFVSVLGLYGLITYTSSQRLQEISIRKAMGASNIRLVFLLLSETISLVLVATSIAWIIAYFIVNKWLDGFYLRIDIHPLYFILSACLVFFVSILTVIFNAAKVALNEPGISLKYE